ncbi:MAG: hypothetical protein AB7G93_10030 [Bdellovibrionales bacterium]
MSISQLIEFTGLNYKTIRKRLKPLTPVREDGRAKFYDTKGALPLLFPQNTTEMNHERLRLARAKADREEFELAIKRGDYWDAEGTLEDVGRQFTAVRARLLAIPNKAALLLARETEPSRCQKLVYNEICEALADLSADKLKVGHEKETQNEEGNPDQ